MLKICKWPVAITCAAALLTGCSAQMRDSMFKPPLTTVSPAAGAQTDLPIAAANAPAAPSVPYVLRAESAGPYIDFSIYNLGTTDMVVEKEYFAIISPDDREVVPYDKSSTIIDLPQPAVVKPHETIQGRAIFREVNSPVGKRLVYKPDAIGTFADINRANGLSGVASTVANEL